MLFKQNSPINPAERELWQVTDVVDGRPCRKRKEHAALQYDRFDGPIYI
jgi:hypothetical protein